MLLDANTNEIPPKWHKKISCDSKIKKLSRQYDEMLHEIELGEYREKQKADFQMRKVRIRKLIKAGEIIEQAGLLDCFINTAPDMVVAKIKRMLKEDD